MDDNAAAVKRLQKNSEKPPSRNLRCIVGDAADVLAVAGGRVDSISQDRVARATCDRMRRTYCLSADGH